MADAIRFQLEDGKVAAAPGMTIRRAEAAANLLTNPQLGPYGKIPGFKFCAARGAPARDSAAPE